MFHSAGVIILTLKLESLMFSDSDGVQGLMMYYCTNQDCSKSITFQYKGDSANESEDD